jgi:hypothetical protein
MRLRTNKTLGLTMPGRGKVEVEASRTAQHAPASADSLGDIDTWRTLSCVPSPEPREAPKLPHGAPAAAAIAAGEREQVRYICGEAFNATLGGGFGLPSSEGGFDTDAESADGGHGSAGGAASARGHQRIRAKSMLGDKLIPCARRSPASKALRPQQLTCSKLLA